MGVKLGHAKFQPLRGTFSNWGLNVFQWKSGHISETVRHTA